MGVEEYPTADADVPMPADVEIIDPIASALWPPLPVRLHYTKNVLGFMRAREWRFGLTLLLPLEVTNLVLRKERGTMRTRLSIEVLEDLVAVAEGSKGACPSSLGRSGAIYRRRSAERLSTISPRSCGR